MPETLDCKQSFKALCERVVVIDHGRLVYDGQLTDLTRHYGDVKVLTLDLAAPVAREVLAEYGEVTAWEPTKVSVRIPREQVPSAAASLLGTLDVLDLTIQEPDVEDVIRELFSGQLTVEEP
jgi:ABC-2 type transport system ATP-binding protein